VATLEYLIMDSIRKWIIVFVLKRRFKN